MNKLKQLHQELLKSEGMNYENHETAYSLWRTITNRVEQLINKHDSCCQEIPHKYENHLHIDNDFSFFEVPLDNKSKIKISEVKKL